MDLYAKIRDLDSRVRAGETTLLAVLDELRLLRAERLTRTQMEAATKPNEEQPAPEPQPVEPQRRGPGRPRKA